MILFWSAMNKACWFVLTVMVFKKHDVSSLIKWSAMIHFNICLIICSLAPEIAFDFRLWGCISQFVNSGAYLSKRESGVLIGQIEMSASEKAS